MLTFGISDTRIPSEVKEGIFLGVSKMLDKIEQDALTCISLADITAELRKEKQKKVDLLVKEVLSLNPACNEIGAGKMNRLIELAKELS